MLVTIPFVTNLNIATFGQISTLYPGHIKYLLSTIEPGMERANFYNVKIYRKTALKSVARYIVLSAA